jgi:hypothetical protein
MIGSMADILVVSFGRGSGCRPVAVAVAAVDEVIGADAAPAAMPAATESCTQCVEDHLNALG